MTPDHSAMPASQGDALHDPEESAGEAPAPRRRQLPLVLAVLGGLAGSWAGLPAGAFVGAMALTGIASVSGLLLCPLPVVFRTVAQVGLGALIGLNVNPEVIGVLRAMLLPTLAVT